MEHCNTIKAVLADLHTHSAVSDGQYSPAELVTLAKERGVEVLSLTDHDTLDGMDEALAAGKELGVQVIRGVELSAKEHKNLHILGYNFASENSALSNLCAEMRRSRDERKYRIIDYLHEKSVDISLAEVEELVGGNVIARPHFAQVMVRRGYVASNREAFDRYLDTDEYQRIERFKADARTCVETIKDAGGKVSLAHPYQLKMNNSQLETLVRELVGYGLDAIECYYPRHTSEQTDFYLELASQYGLHVTGGSDFHGERVKPDIELAKLPLEIGWLVI